MFRIFVICFFLFSAAVAKTQQKDVAVGILRSAEQDQVLVLSTQSPLVVLVDGQRAGELSAKDGLRISVAGGLLTAKSLSRVFNVSRSISVRTSGHGTVRVSTLGKVKIERDYSGSIEVSRSGGSLLLVNNVPIEEYVAGVVQSEAGDHKGLEYYKLQAVSCRTYAITNIRKHLPDGFNVCDGTHCQVYKGVCKLDTVSQAVAATADMVVVDADIRLIHATFHSNCGGETMNAEDVWSRPEAYLVSAMDTFCLRSPHATWHKTMPRSKWLDYLHRTYKLNTSDTASVRAVTTFDPTCRSMYIDGASPLIPLEQVRADMKFNSAYFTIWPNGEDVVFDGRGFGHGVGLCQEGAMCMARAGLPFTEILHHYFAEVHLVDLHTLDFFRDEGR
ncbi:MAG: SpoIID/LytB domain-containing protein [Flavobacteriales bacterium]|nr:SpoIID/LytB domain-containing protein [Flavobacteriales bacterium]